jgi:hypothetical protein
MAIHGPKIPNSELEQTQSKHYGRTRLCVNDMRKAIDHIREVVDRQADATVSLPREAQQTFWSNEKLALDHGTVRILGLSGDRIKKRLETT